MSLLQGSDVLLLQSRATPGLHPHSAGTLSFDIDVIFEDEHIAAVVKPPGMLMHRGARKGSTHGNTLVAALPHVLAPTWHEDALARPVALHRLDQGTGALATLSKLCSFACRLRQCCGPGLTCSSSCDALKPL